MKKLSKLDKPKKVLCQKIKSEKLNQFKKLTEFLEKDETND